MKPPFAHVETWLFDMDNTLYHPRANLFAQIDVRMEAYVAELLGLDRAAARVVQKRYFHEHGTTLRGLMNDHGVAPADFLAKVHDLDFSVLSPDPRVVAGLARLPGRKYVFTNGDADYAARVLGALGIGAAFDGVFDIHAMEYRPKPDPLAYEKLVAALDFDPAKAFFAEDMAHNLKPAKALGMATLWVNNGSERGGHGAHPDFIDQETHDFAEWLEAITA
ncbi:pyrimidine 5'-nucleotidase [Sandaracinobacteroides saxicola]|uniref:Pyrimidine 5'-nucleotidase n=1 Tax=Sandaracinobacteroides saxicola TaxID=2759707 RepID=A0A7G5IFU8_9SPHN|nr:pyrimidine 5'-nucleotidase [Sandaracinobacteroides saxicola]QMW22240.1 pyrimidine 5'-nucleotidase [Sandaracinobacteroides saxicola]